MDEFSFASAAVAEADESAFLPYPRTPAGRSPASPAGPPVVPGYEILDELGRGGMGVVYRARQLGLNRTVALKMIRAGAETEGVNRSRFLAEAEAVAGVRHPNVVQVYGSGNHAGQPFFALEYLEGGSLADRLCSAGSLPADEAARVVEPLARAVQAAHRAGIVHRDLKPANVLFAADGTPKVTDFGCATRLDGSEGQPATDRVIGTPSYMSPEQAAGREDQIGPAADVYALGAVLYEALTGRPPFRGQTPVDTLLHVLGSEPTPPRRVRPGLPRDLEAVCLKALARRPEDRYASAADLADDLRRFLAGEPMRARPRRCGERIARWLRRRPTAAAALGLLALALALGGAAAEFRLRAEQAEAQLADARAREAELRRQLAEMSASDAAGGGSSQAPAVRPDP